MVFLCISILALKDLFDSYLLAMDYTCCLETFLVLAVADIGGQQ